MGGRQQPNSCSAGIGVGREDFALIGYFQTRIILFLFFKKFHLLSPRYVAYTAPVLVNVATADVRS